MWSSWLLLDFDMCRFTHDTLYSVCSYGARRKPYHPSGLLQVSFSREEDNFVRLVVTVPEERTQAAHSKIVAALRKDYNVPGFRNNEKVPVDMLVQAAGGEKQFKFACVEELMHGTIEEVCSRIIVQC